MRSLPPRRASGAQGRTRTPTRARFDARNIFFFRQLCGLPCWVRAALALCIRECQAVKGSAGPRPRPRGRVYFPPMLLRVGLWAVLLAAFLAVVSLTTGFHRVRLHEPGEASRPLVVHESGYVGSETCHSCHPREHATWHDSYHRRMTQKATPAAVIAPFDGVRLEANGRVYE